MAQDPNPTRLFFAPTARAVGQGRGYLGVYEIFFPFVTYGVTNSFSISAGTPIIPEIIGEVFYIAPKRGGDRARWPRAGELLYGSDGCGRRGDRLRRGHLRRPRRRRFRGSRLGRSADNELGPAILMVGGELRMTSRTKFISENYFAPGRDGALISGDIRFFGERLSADLGIGRHGRG